MNSFRRAPWYLKLLLIFLPIVLCGKLAAYAMSFHAIANTEYTQESVIWLVTNAAVITFVAAVSWFAWRPQLFSRWLVAAFMSLAIIRTIYQWFYPWELSALLASGRPEVAPESSNTVILLVLILWWGYLCVFSKRSIAYYSTSKTVGCSSSYKKSP